MSQQVRTPDGMAPAALDDGFGTRIDALEGHVGHIKDRLGALEQALLGGGGRIPGAATPWGSLQEHPGPDGSKPCPPYGALQPGHDKAIAPYGVGGGGGAMVPDDGLFTVGILSQLLSPLLQGPGSALLQVNGSTLVSFKLTRPGFGGRVPIAFSPVQATIQGVSAAVSFGAGAQGPQAIGNTDAFGMVTFNVFGLAVGTDTLRAVSTKVTGNPRDGVALSVVA